MILEISNCDVAMDIVVSLDGEELRRFPTPKHPYDHEVWADAQRFFDHVQEFGADAIHTIDCWTRP